MRVNRSLVIAEAVAASFESAGFSPADLLQGPIKITDLPWQAPPLRCKLQLRGLPLHEYLDYPYNVNSEELYNFYRLGLMALHGGVTEVANADGYIKLRPVAPLMSPGERALAFHTPENFPAGDPNSGPIFAMEAARLFRTSSEECLDFVEDEDNYYAKTPWGLVGVVDGYTSESEDLWNVSFSGFVQSMLEQPRGYTSYDCSYDLLARVRSALHEQAQLFPEFEAIDFALQALRLLAYTGVCTELQKSVQRMSIAAFSRKARLQAFEQAVEVMDSWSMTDRAKISSLMEILVPSYYSLGQFSQKILDPRRLLPAVLSNKVEERIKRVLADEVRQMRLTVKPL